MISACEMILSTSQDGEEGEDSQGDDLVRGGVARVLSHSTVCFETLMRLYYLRHGYETPDDHTSHNLMILAYKGLSQRYMAPMSVAAVDPEAISPTEARSTLILAAKELYNQGANYYLPYVLFQIIERKMSPKDREMLHNYVPSRTEDVYSLQAR